MSNLKKIFEYEATIKEKSQLFFRYKVSEKQKKSINFFTNKILIFMILNKKAIAGMAVAMMLSLGIMQGINAKKEVVDTNLIWGIGSAIATYDSEGSLGAYIGLSCYGVLISAGWGYLYGNLAGAAVGL